MSDKTFDILDHLSGRSYPETKVKVYFDEASMREAVALESAINSERDSDKVAIWEEELEALHAKIDSTALTFHLRGVPYEVKEALNKKASEIKDEMERNIYSDIAALEASTVKVTNAEGASASFDHDRLEAIVKALPDHEQERILQAVKALSYEAVLYERIETTPDF